MSATRATLLRALAAPLVLALAILAAAPMLGALRDLLLAWSPTAFVRLLAAGFLAAVGGVLLLSVARVRRFPGGRFARLAALALALAVAALLLTAFGTGQAQVDAVERAHLLAYGLLTFALARALAPLGRGPALALAALGATLVAVLDEWLQWLVPSRVGEARDILLNVGSTLPGLLWAGATLRWPAPEAWARPLARRALPIAVAALTLTFAAFLDCAHLGHRLADPEIGSFLSFFDADELARARAERERRWRERPPERPSPWGREDYFLTEATWRVQHRNAALAQGDFATAWRENRLLERHYDPVLDVRSFRSGEPHRWPDWQRAEVDRRRPEPLEATYASPVLARRIWTRPGRGAVWTAAALAAAALLALAARAGRSGLLGRRLRGGSGYSA